ncbi:hypothetical protein BV378_24515 [Nostoc sp. RF31YmG]|nr:hypothetical protein BV378_24515 [Nostoc sp. RF31YmG]
MTTNTNNFLFRLVAKFIKYFALALFGLAIAFVLSSIFGGMHIASALLPFVFKWIVLRCGIILFCLILTTVIVESVR